MRTHSLPSHAKPGRLRKQRGAAIIEFAFVALLFFTILIGIMEFGRWMYTLNAATEATRLGARLAAVCSKSDQNKIKEKMRFFVPGVTADQISIHYMSNNVLNDDCSADWTASIVCESVTVKLEGATFTTFIPFLAASYAMPPFTTTLPRELMNGDGNPACS